MSTTLSGVFNSCATPTTISVMERCFLIATSALMSRTSNTRPRGPSAGTAAGSGSCASLGSLPWLTSTPSSMKSPSESATRANGSIIAFFILEMSCETSGSSSSISTASAT